VQTVQSGAIQVFKEGNSWAQVDYKALELLTRALLDLQLLNGPYETLLHDRVAYAFMPHGLGHPVGLDVHDPIPTEYKVNPVDQSLSNSGNTKVDILSRLSIKSIDFPIVRGSVMTIEPGIYFIPHWLESLRQNRTDPLGKWINWTRVDEFGYGIGGVRIEDTLAIDPVTGNRIVLTDF
jgi:Xaa-Pro aminopeptidase